MAGEWRPSTWGKEVTLEYGKALRGHDKAVGQYRVYGSNGPIGWTTEPLAPGPGVVLGRKGAYRGVEYSPDPFFVIDTAYYVAPKNPDLDMRWLYYAIKHYKLGEIDDGSPIPSTTRAAVYVRELQVPPVNEQRAIGAILGALDDKIELNRRMSETLEAMARALFKSWFIDFDPVRAKTGGRDTGLSAAVADLFPDRFVDSPIGPIPDGWTAEGLDAAGTFLNGLAMQKYPATKDGPYLPVIKIAQLRAGHTANADRANTGVPADYVIADGDVLFSWSGSLECRIWSGGPGALNQHLFKVTSDRFPKWLLYLSIHQHLDAFRHIAAGKATTMGHIQRRHLTEAVQALPDGKLVEAVNDQFTSLLDRALSASVEARSLALLRDALLPLLVSGGLRVPDVERVLERTAS